LCSLRQHELFDIDRLGHFVAELGRLDEAGSSVGRGSAAAADTTHGVDEATPICVLSGFHRSQSVGPCGQRHWWQLQVGPS